MIGTSITKEVNKIMNQIVIFKISILIAQVNQYLNL